MDEVKTRHEALLSRLEGASSVATEAQEVVKVEDSIQELEVWLVSCGKFAANQNILGQIEEHRVSFLHFLFVCMTFVASAKHNNM